MSGDGRRRTGDEVPPEGGGLFRRIAPAQGSALSGMVGAFETVFAPNKDEARQEIQRQRHTGARTPSPEGPPDVHREGEGRVAAEGRPGTPFSGRIVLRDSFQV